jgi:hypothetical protein
VDASQLVGVRFKSSLGWTNQVGLVCRKARKGQHQEKEEQGQDGKSLGGSGDNTTVPGENGELVQAGGQVPTSSRVSCDEDSKRYYGEGVHLQRHAKR